MQKSTIGARSVQGQDMTKGSPRTMYNSSRFNRDNRPPCSPRQRFFGASAPSRRRLLPSGGVAPPSAGGRSRVYSGETTPLLSWNWACTILSVADLGGTIVQVPGQGMPRPSRSLYGGCTTRFIGHKCVKVDKVALATWRPFG